jgi:hypothetical protein
VPAGLAVSEFRAGKVASTAEIVTLDDVFMAGVRKSSISLWFINSFRYCNDSLKSERGRIFFRVGPM